MERMERMELSAQRDLPVLLVRKAQVELPALLALQELRVQLVLQAQQVPRVPRVPMAQPVQLAQPVLQALQVQRVWQRCC